MVEARLVGDGEPGLDAGVLPQADRMSMIARTRPKAGRFLMTVTGTRADSGLPAQ